MAETEMLDPQMMEMVDPFNRPIPGQSLTNPVDNPYPWEKAPRFTKASNAIDFFAEGILGDQERLSSVLEILASNTFPIAEIAQILLEDGFRKGYWNPDLMLLLAEPVMVILMALSERAGFNDYEIYLGERSELDEEEKIELTNSVINAIKEDIDFKGFRKKGGLDIRSVEPEVLKTIEKIDLPKAPSLLAPQQTPQEEMQAPSLLGKV
tara:strand:+ start:2438 stop:3064 length:627 start_codon:yes stop_codon:yes gene_type:complete